MGCVSTKDRLLSVKFWFVDLCLVGLYANAQTRQEGDARERDSLRYVIFIARICKVGVNIVSLPPQNGKVRFLSSYRLKSAERRKEHPDRSVGEVIG